MYTAVKTHVKKKKDANSINTDQKKKTFVKNTVFQLSYVT